MLSITGCNFFPRTHELYSQEILRNMRQILKSLDEYCFTVHLKFYKWKMSKIHLNLEILHGFGSLSCIFWRNMADSDSTMAHRKPKQIVPCIVQGVPQYCFHFCFVYFSASKLPRTYILDIFQQPSPRRF